MRWFGLTIALLALLSVHTSAYPRIRRQAELRDSDNLTPLSDDNLDDPAEREKRMLEGVSQAKFGVKNAILGFVFGKINQLIDSKTRLIEQLDQQNIAKNKQYGIELPQSGNAGIGGAISSIIGPKLQLIGPKLNLITGALGGLSGGLSGGSSSSSDSSGGSGSGLGSLLRIFSSLSGSSSSGGGGSGSVTISDNDNDDDDDDDDDDDGKDDKDNE